MKRSIVLAVWASTLIAAADLKPLVDGEKDWLLNTYQQLHKNPELSGEERQTSAFVAKTLRELGFEVTAPFGSYRDPSKTPYGVIGLLRNGPGPVVLIRADMDALPIQEDTGLPWSSTVPGVMHACGHDANVTSALGAARLLVSLKDRWRGTVMIVGQPAEETDIGAKSILDAGLYTRFPKPDFALAVHLTAGPAGSIHYGSGYVLANIDSVDITMRGIGSHGAAPQTAKDPIVMSAELVMALQTIISREKAPTEAGVITVGAIHGGTQHNIIPDEVKLKITVRSSTPEVRKLLLSSIERMTNAVATLNGVPADRMPIVTVDDNTSVPALYNDPALTVRMAELFREEFGAERVTEHHGAGMGGDDFGNYSLTGKFPGFIFYVGATDPELLRHTSAVPGTHSSHFAPLPEPTLKTGAEALTAAVLNLLSRGDAR